MNNVGSLFVIYTPLHALIVLEIIKYKSIKDYSVIYISNNTPVNRNYFNKVSKNSKYCKFISNDKYGIKTFVNMVALKFKISSFENVYFSNIKKIQSRIVYGILSPEEIFTLDDGSGNITGDGYFYKFNDTFMKTVILNIAFPLKRLGYGDLVKKIITHYSIFKAENVYEPVSVRLPFLDKGTFSADLKDDNHKCYYLGNAFSEDGECSEDYERKIFEFVERMYGVDAYLPHPREDVRKSKKIAGDKLIDVGFSISEDLIFGELQEGYTLTVVGVYSTALLNLSGIQGVQCVNVNAEIRKPVEKLKVVMRGMGIALVDFIDCG